MVDGPLDVDQRRQDLAVSRLGVRLATFAEGVEIVGRVERDQHRVDPRGFELHRGDPPSRGSRYSATTASFSSTPIPGASESVMCPSRATASPTNSSDRNVSPSR